MQFSEKSGPFWLTSAFFKHPRLETTITIDFPAELYSIKVSSFIVHVHKISIFHCTTRRDANWKVEKNCNFLKFLTRILGHYRFRLRGIRIRWNFDEKKFPRGTFQLKLTIFSYIYKESHFFKHLRLETTTPIDFSAMVYYTKVSSFVAQAHQKSIVRNVSLDIPAWSYRENLISNFSRKFTLFWRF